MRRLFFVAGRLSSSRVQGFVLRGGQFEMLVSALTAELAENQVRLRFAAADTYTLRHADGSLVDGRIARDYQEKHAYYQAGRGRRAALRYEDSPVTSSRHLEVFELGLAHHPRRWDEQRGVFVAVPPSNPRMDTLNRLALPAPARKLVPAKQAGFADARRLWKPTKRLEPCRRSAGKGHGYKKDSPERHAYEQAFTWMWGYLTKHPTAKRRSKKVAAAV